MIRAFAGSQFCPMGHELLLDAPMLSVTADPARRRVTTSEWIAEHLASPGLPRGHGFTAQAARDGRAWYAFDAASVRCLMLDTVTLNGGWQGSLDREQFTWLADQLADARRQGARWAACCSATIRSTPSSTCGRSDGAERAGARRGCPADRRGGQRDRLGQRPRPRLRDSAPALGWGGSGTWWEITTASHIDWPQQARIVELAADESGLLVVACTSLDHHGLIDPRLGVLDDPLTLACGSRELAANQWQPVR